MMQSDAGFRNSEYTLVKNHPARYVSAIAAALLLLNVCPANAQAAPDFAATGQPISAAPADPAIRQALGQVSPRQIRRTIETLVSFGNRNTLSSMETSLPQGTGVSAAADWLQKELQQYSADCGGCLEVKTRHLHGDSSIADSETHHDHQRLRSLARNRSQAGEADLSGDGSLRFAGRGCTQHQIPRTRCKRRRQRHGGEPGMRASVEPKQISINARICNGRGRRTGPEWQPPFGETREVGRLADSRRLQQRHCRRRHHSWEHEAAEVDGARFLRGHSGNDHARTIAGNSVAGRGK